MRWFMRCRNLWWLFYFGMVDIEMLFFVWCRFCLGLSLYVHCSCCMSSRCRHRFVMRVVLCKSYLISIRFRVCELRSFSRRWLKSCGNTKQHIYVSDALLFLCVHLFCGCVRAHSFCVVWIACAFRSVRVAFVH